MNNKVTDIYPPQKERTALTAFKESKPRFCRKGLFVFPVILFVLVIFCYFFLPYFQGRAEIDLWPETEVLSLETELTAEQGAGRYDISEKVIPGQVYQKEKTIIESFPSSGRVLKEKKAEGIIRVYNEYSVSSQVLVATTRFVSADNKVFRTPVAVTVPGGQYEGGKFVPGEIDIKVVADQPGLEYNIGPSTFSIPGFAGTDRYTKFYAKSFQAMEGGFEQEILVVTKDDLDKAEDYLAERAKEECGRLLEKDLDSISAQFTYFPGGFQARIAEKTPLALPGEEADEFKFQVKAVCETLLLLKEDLENFAEELIAYQVPEGKDIYRQSMEIHCYPEKGGIDLAAGRAFLSANISVKIFPDIDFSNLKKALSGKSSLEIKMFLESQPEIAKTEVSFRPFWMKKAPADLNRIKININID